MRKLESGSPVKNIFSFFSLETKHGERERGIACVG
jgi:hypothetical protein